MPLCLRDTRTDPGELIRLTNVPVSAEHKDGPSELVRLIDVLVPAEHKDGP